jgi:serine/threonine protein kinase
MKALRVHPHLVSMLGTSEKNGDEPCLVVEFCLNGDLLHFVRDHSEKILRVGFSPLPSDRNFRVISMGSDFVIFYLLPGRFATEWYERLRRFRIYTCLSL